MNGVKHLGPVPAIQGKAERSGVWVHQLQSQQSEKGCRVGCINRTHGERQVKGENGRGGCVDVDSQGGSWVDQSIRAVLLHVQWREKGAFLYI